MTPPCCVYWPMLVSSRNSGTPQVTTKARYGTRKAPGRATQKTQKKVLKYKEEGRLCAAPCDQGKLYLLHFCSRGTGTSRRCPGPPRSPPRPGGTRPSCPSVLAPPGVWAHGSGADCPCVRPAQDLKPQPTASVCPRLIYFTLLRVMTNCLASELVPRGTNLCSILCYCRRSARDPWPLHWKKPQTLTVNTL